MAKVGQFLVAIDSVERFFRARYRSALASWRVGVREVAFPSGTWGMVVLHGAFTEAIERA